MNDYSQLPEDFLIRGRKLQAFVETHGRLPKQSCADSESERHLGDFLRVARMRTHAERSSSQTPIRHAWLDEHVPSWRTENRRANTSTRNVDTFDKRVAQVVRFVEKHGHLPRCRVDNVRERALGTFLMNQRQAKRGKGTTAWTEERGAKLDAMVPGWDSVSANRHFIGRVAAVAAFVRRAGRAPRLVSHNAAEVALARFVSRYAARSDESADLLERAMKVAA